MRLIGQSLVLLLLPLLSGCLQSWSAGGFVPIDGALLEDAAASADGGTTGSDGTASGADTGATPGADTVGPGPADTTLPGTPQVVHPQCLDGQHAEAALPKAPIGTLLQGYDASEYLAFIDGVLQARYPVGQWLVQGGLKKQNCVDMFLPASQRGTAKAVLQRLSTVVHECGHFYDIASSGFASSTYQITPERSLTCQGLKYSGSNPGFARSLLLKDEYAALRPPCPPGQFGNGCDTYAAIYLSGEPGGKFESGDQGYDSVLEETTQYVNSLATDLAISDQLPYSVSARDGILTFLWYTERYLRLARLQHPAVYKYLSGNACWREATLTLWGRAWFYLQASKSNPKLSLDGPALEKLVLDPELLSEIARLRIAHGCPG